MMPAAQLKMLRYMRNPNSEPKGNGPGSPRAGGQPAPQHAPPPLAARQPLVDVAKMPVPGSGRYTSATLPPSSIPTMNMAGSKPPMPRARANSDTGRGLGPSEREQQMWEDSTVNSMFADSASGGAARQRAGNGNYARYDSPFPQAQLPYERNVRQRASEELNPFVIGENGLLKVLSSPSKGATAASPLMNLSAQAGASMLVEDGDSDPYTEKKALLYESPSKINNSPSLKHAKYPFRDARTARRGSFPDRAPLHGSGDEGLCSSPERFGSVTGRLAEAVKMEAPDRDLAHKRSTFFHDVDTPQGRTPAPPDDDASEAPTQGDEATNQQQRTPRQHLPRPPMKAPMPPLPPLPPLAPLLSPSQKKNLQESSLPRTSGNQRDKRTSRKRRLSPDYDDHALHTMSYTDLKNQDFDYDPARVAIQAAALPSGEHLEDKLAYYKGKDENSQHHFFTQVTVDEWEACGDWFLDQFSNVVQKMKERRQAKRRMVATFEAEIAEREEVVRVKVESIDRTLGELRQEGEGMMRGRLDL